MANLVLLTEAVEHSKYTLEHLRYLVRENKVNGKKVGGVYLIDLDDLAVYEQRMDELGTKKFTSRGGQADA